ncbi:transcriptional regulator [Streptosporangium violaceochromogenes]|nr:transcriptional regulator [Streptosporangium violaceochromogenes]
MDDLIHELPTARWRTSTLSGDDGSNCVEVAALSGGHHALRDTKDRTGPALILTPAAWAGLLASIKAGRLD